MGRRRPGARRGGGHRRGGGKAAMRRSPTLTGTLRVSRPGMATVETPEGTFRVARRGLREAMNGDEVTVSVFPARGGEKVALVQGVITRAQTTFLGRFEPAGPLGAVVPLDARLGRDFFVVPEDDSPARLGVGEGDVVVARIAEYPTRNSAAVVTIERRVGSSDELDLNIESVIASYGLATEFPPAALAQAEGIQAGVEEALKREPGRRDLRSLRCVTIDPTDARDFDDAVFATRLQDGGFELWVHIADVTHYVGWDSPIDNEAKRRTCSAYLVDRVLPMLPERLCNDVCSLRPHEDRLAMSVRMELDAAGNLVAAEAMTSAIRSTARLDYDTVDALLAGRVDASALHEDQKDAQVLEEALRVLDRIRGLRERIREERGSIDFDIVEPKVTLDEEGHPTGVTVRTRTRATGLVEEAMLLANESVARMLADREVPCAYRVHERPSPEDLRATVRPLMELGLIDGNAQREALIAGEPEAINAVLDAARGTSGELLASALLLRAQKRAIYLPTNQGHYALGAQAYCHFTSPIRRYPDELVHRALKALLAGTLGSKEQGQIAGQLPQLCATCSQMERATDAAARASQHIKMAELYAVHVGEVFSGVVCGCERFGLFVMLDETCAEGLLPARALGGEWLEYDEDRMTLTGEESGRVWGLGTRVRVLVTETDVPRGRIDFALADARDAAR
ncbi:ribonuclease R [Olsenella sp. kh2p3]|uniref:ribonuclease R n=1 Tax=Olsenella sp. kh2p3 TaxID=1797112 RepID=UPI000931F1D1|nr:ribonuclease R [Olsenella sp. kh2p3]